MVIREPHVIDICRFQVPHRQRPRLLEALRGEGVRQAPSSCPEGLPEAVSIEKGILLALETRPGDAHTGLDGHARHGLQARKVSEFKRHTTSDIAFKGGN